MIKTTRDELIGSTVAKLMAVYFKAIDDVISNPNVIVFSGKSGRLYELMADGNGGVKLGQNPIDRLFFDEAIGYSFIAPLLKVFDGSLNGSEIIDDVCLSETVNKTIITLLMDNKKTLELRFEDDELYLELT